MWEYLEKLEAEDKILSAKKTFANARPSRIFYDVGRINSDLYNQSPTGYRLAWYVLVMAKGVLGIGSIEDLKAFAAQNTQPCQTKCQETTYADQYATNRLYQEHAYCKNWDKGIAATRVHTALRHLQSLPTPPTPAEMRCTL